MTTYDTIVVGAGPAGSTAARRLAERGARVLLLDRARFPRDKPCGGGVTVRAAREAGIDLSPVVEREVTEAWISYRLGKPFLRSSQETLSYMTQRRDLDAYLAERAAAAGAEFRDGLAAGEIELESNSVTLRADPSTALRTGPSTALRAGGDVYHARTLIGADGANGIVARALGLEPSNDAAIALEGNIPMDAKLIERWGHAIALDLGGTPGGYGWLFPKSDHLNVGVGGWRWIGPTLRERLSALCRHLELDESKLWGLRGHHLPLRAPGGAIVRGQALLAGDAAGFVDPLSGEGIDAAFASGRIAAEAVGAYLSGEAADLRGYEPAVERELMADIEVSRRLQSLFQRFPRPCVAVLRRSDRFWRVLSAFVRGEATYTGLRRRMGPLGPVMDAAARLSAPKAPKSGHRPSSY